MLAQLEEVTRGKQDVEQQLVVALQEELAKTAHDQKEAECQEVTMMLKEVVEENSQS